jgi:hypothetical protein
VTYSPEAIPEREPGAEPSPKKRADKLAMMRSANFGVEKIERLPFNIGYLPALQANDPFQFVFSASSSSLAPTALVTGLCGYWPVVLGVWASHDLSHHSQRPMPT